MIVGYIDKFDSDACAGWVLDTESLSSPLPVALIVNGETVHTETANLERADLHPQYGSSKHGFSFGLSRYLKHGKNVAELVLVKGDFAFRNAKKVIDTRDLASLVQEGRDGFLFLHNDSNDVSGIIEGRRPLSREDARSLSLMLIRRFHTVQALGARCATIVAPEKGVICNDKRISPFPVSDNRPAVQLRDALSGWQPAVYSYATTALDGFPDKTAAYLKTDTHLSSAGQYALFRHAMNLLNFSPRIDCREHRRDDFCGDLGSKLSPRQTEIANFRVPVYKTRNLIDEVTPVVENGGSLRYKRLYHESGADNDLTCVLVGTSGAYYLREWFFAAFQKVHFYWANVVDDGFLRQVEPNYVACIITERTIGATPKDNDAAVSPLFASKRSGRSDQPAGRPPRAAGEAPPARR